jgi:hypothetical protein
MTAKVFYDFHEDDLNSSAIAEVFYDSYNLELFVKFHNGTLAGYSGVPQERYDRLVDAASVGSYYSWSIRGSYDGINGDVDLQPRAKVEPVAEGPVQEKKDFDVRVELTGELQFLVNARDFAGAEKLVTDLVNKALIEGTFVIGSVTRNS